MRPRPHNPVTSTCTQVQQRDNEINILVSMLQRREGGGGRAGGGAAVSALQGVMPLNQSPSAPRPSGPMAADGSGAPSVSDMGGRTGPASVSSSVDDIAALMNTNLLGDRNKAFELFRKSYRQNEVGGDLVYASSGELEALR